MCGTAAFAVRKTPVRFTSMTSRQAWASVAATSAGGPPMPALAIAQSSRPSVATPSPRPAVGARPPRPAGGGTPPARPRGERLLVGDVRLEGDHPPVEGLHRAHGVGQVL